MQASMPGTLNGEAARAELQQLGNATTPASPGPADPPALVGQGSAPVDEQPAAPVAAPSVKEAPKSASPAPSEQDSEEQEADEAPEASVTPSAASRRRKDTPKTTEPAPSSSTDGSGGAVRISSTHANELLAARLHFQTEHKTKVNNQGLVADALDHYLAHLRKKGVLPPKP